MLIRTMMIQLAVTLILLMINNDDIIVMIHEHL